MFAATACDLLQGSYCTLTTLLACTEWVGGVDLASLEMACHCVFVYLAHRVALGIFALAAQQQSMLLYTCKGVLSLLFGFQHLACIIQQTMQLHHWGVFRGVWATCVCVHVQTGCMCPQGMLMVHASDGSPAQQVCMVVQRARLLPDPNPVVVVSGLAACSIILGWTTASLCQGGCMEHI